MFLFVFMFLIHEKPGVVYPVSLLLKMLVFPPNNSGILKVFLGDPGGTSLNQVCQHNSPYLKKKRHPTDRSAIKFVGVVVSKTDAKAMDL